MRQNYFRKWRSTVKFDTITQESDDFEMRLIVLIWQQAGATISLIIFFFEFLTH